MQQPPELKDLSIGIQTFDILIEENRVYVDKTEQIYPLVRKSERYFLARPRRFGKSLLISTFKALFEGKRELFKNLWIDSSDYSWTKYPVIHLDFSGFDSRSVDSLEKDLIARLGDIAQAYGVPFETDGVTLTRALTVLVKNLFAKAGKRVVVLVDEYDSPLLAHIDDPAVRDPIHVLLKGFYTALKSMDKNLHFFFVTGVSKFSKTSLFSGFNNLSDLSAQEETATLLGYTEEELYRYFDGWIPHVATKLQEPVSTVKEKIREWYDGYRFSGNPTRVYNPFSFLTFLRNAKFSDYWFASGTPTFLLKLIKTSNFPISDLENAAIDDIDFPAYEIDKQELIPLMFQTGYLTIKGYQREPQRYILSYPNIEVKNAFFKHIVKMLTNFDSVKTYGFYAGITEALEAGDTDKFLSVLGSFFAGISYELQPAPSAPVATSEFYYQSLMFALLRFVGMHVHAEEPTNKGRIDATIETKKYVYIIECKINAPCAIALEQIHAKSYYEPYWHKGKQIVLIGLVFDTKTRMLGECLVEVLR